MTREELRDYVDEQRTLNNIPYHVYSALIDGIDTLEQEPKTGYWIDIKQYHFYNDGDIETTELMCSCCKETVEWDVELPHKPHHCENCGAKMVETPESEEQ